MKPTPPQQARALHRSLAANDRIGKRIDLDLPSPSRRNWRSLPWRWAGIVALIFATAAGAAWIAWRLLP